MTDQAVPAEGASDKVVTGLKIQPKKLQPLRRLLPFMLAYPVRLGLTVLFLLVSAITSLAIPAMLGGVIDQGFIEQNLDMVGRYGGIIIAIAAVMAIASGARF